MCFIIQVFPKAFLVDIWDENVGSIGIKRDLLMGGAYLCGNAEKIIILK
jgi:hypothetical protein